MDKIRFDLSICPELKPSVCLPELLAFDKALIISLATCPSSSMSALYGPTRKHQSVVKQAMRTAPQLDSENMQKSTFSTIQAHFYR